MSPTSTSEFKPGDVILVDVPFTDLSQRKKRPAAVLLSRGSDHLAAFFTSRLEQTGPENVIVTATPENGLAVDSALIVTKLFTLHESLIVRRLGHLSTRDHRALVQRLVKLLSETVDL